MIHDFMTMHSAKTVEYLIAVSYLLLFIPFWRYVNARPHQAAIGERVRAQKPRKTDWFSVPDHLFFHPGHAWVRVDGPDTATVGLDDFARTLVGVPSDIALPPVGAMLAQGEPAWTLVAGDKAIEMLAPMDGTVVEVNAAVRQSPALAHDDPYNGWLLKLRSPRLASDLKQLMTGGFARRWVEDLADGLRGAVMPALGQVSEDGGGVVDGLARELESDDWDRVVRRFFLTEQPRPGVEQAPRTEGGNHA